MAGVLRHTINSYRYLIRPIQADALSLRSISLGATQLSNKSSKKADTKTAASPKTTPPKQPAPASSTGDTYQVPEYYGFNEYSYYDLESDMRKSRLPQPTPGKPSI